MKNRQFNKLCMKLATQGEMRDRTFAKVLVQSVKRHRSWVRRRRKILKAQRSLGADGLAMLHNIY